MRVLASADLHGKHSVYEWLVRTTAEHRVDAVILGGDLLGCPDGFSTPEQAQRHEARLVSECLEGAGLPVFYIMGNDDLVELQPGSERLQSINGRRVQFGQYTFVGYQYSPSVHGRTIRKARSEYQSRRYDPREITER